MSSNEHISKRKGRQVEWTAQHAHWSPLIIHRDSNGMITFFNSDCLAQCFFFGGAQLFHTAKNKLCYLPGMVSDNHWDVDKDYENEGKLEATL